MFEYELKVEGVCIDRARSTGMPRSISKLLDGVKAGSLCCPVENGNSKKRKENCISFFGCV